MLGAGVEIGLPVVDLRCLDADRALDMARVALEAPAPIVEYAVLLCVPRRWSERVPSVGVLGREPERDLRARPAYQDRQRALRGWRELVEPLHDPRERGGEVTQAAGRGA